MRKIADADELERELRRLLRYTQGELPSRSRIASELEKLSIRLAGGKGEVIESKVWRHKDSGATASLYGAVPWSGAPGDRREDWDLVTRGWTIRWNDGTVGTGRPPFKSRQEAEAYLEKDTGGGWSSFTM